MKKRKIDDSKVFESYRRLMAGESLTEVANSEDINLNRGTLRKYIQEKEAFDLFMRRPKLFTMDSRSFQKSFGLIDKGTEGNAAEQLKKDPWIKFKLNKKTDSNPRDERGEI